MYNNRATYKTIDTNKGQFFILMDLYLDIKKTVLSIEELTTSVESEDDVLALVEHFYTTEFQSRHINLVPADLDKLSLFVMNSKIDFISDLDVFAARLNEKNLTLKVESKALLDGVPSLIQANVSSWYDDFELLHISGDCSIH